MQKTAFTSFFTKLIFCVLCCFANAQSFSINGPSLADFSQLPRDPANNYVLTISGNGFVPQMLLAAYIGPIGPFVIGFNYVDPQNVTVALPGSANATVDFELYKLDQNNNVLVTNRQTTTFIVNAAVDPNGIFVATNGSDSNPGSFNSPYRTIQRGVNALSPGKHLYIRGGTYYETPDINVGGTASQPVIVSGFPGERVVIDSGTSRFRTPGNNDWELVNASLGEWRSTSSFSGGTPWGYVAGIPGYENERVKLIPYPDDSMFRETQTTYTGSSDDYYAGPGLRIIGGRLHIRLQKTPDFNYVEGRYGQVFPAQSPDPRNFSIIVSAASTTLEVTASNVVLANLTVNQGHRTLYMPSSVNNIAMRDVTVWSGYHGMVVDSSSSDFTISRCRFFGDDPQWVCWIDAKRDPGPCDDFRGTNLAFYGGVSDVEINNCLFRGGHDLMGINTDERNFHIHHNVFMNCADDACEWEGDSDIGYIDFHHNYVLNGLVAISPAQDTPDITGPIFVHHNVFALLRPVYVNRVPGVVGWNGGGRYGHEYVFKQHSRHTFYYSNTIVLGDNGSGKGVNITPRDPDECYCMNNIMICVTDGAVQGSYRSGSGLIVDGNLYWKVDPLDSDHLADDYDTVAEIFAGEGFEQNGIGSTPRRGTDPQLAWNLAFSNWGSTPLDLVPSSEVNPITDYFLMATSPARGAAIPVPNHPSFGSLPDANVSNDIGFHDYGASAAQYMVFPFTVVQ